MQFEFDKFETIFFRYVMGFCTFAMLVAIGVYAYLGTFSRYLSDDYCEAIFVKASNPVQAVIDRYTAGEWRAANRTSNLLFVGFGELLGKNNLPITTAAMVLLWPIGLSWSVHEFRKFFKVNWSLPTDCFLGSTLGFFILLQAPNLFQTIYWRSSMMTHFAPLVFGSFLFAFWMQQARRALDGKISLPVYIFIFFTTFIIAGFSEPPVTTMVTALALIMVTIWFWVPSPIKQKIMPLVLWAFAGAFLGLATMVLSPANANLAKDSPSMIVVLRDSFIDGYIFVVYAFRIYPLPNLLSALIPALLVWLYKQQSASELSQKQKRTFWLIIVISPILMWLLIAAGFSPSVYGQGYPVERMRFLACSLMTATFMLEGATFGWLFQNIKFKPNQRAGQWAVAILFSLLSFLYPLRAALKVYQSNVPEYRSRAQLWDLRNAYIIRHASFGETDIVVPGFSGVHDVKELDDDPKHWVNMCAAQFYGVNSIRAVSFPDNAIVEYLSE